MAEISSVHIDIARFCREVYRISDDATLGKWTRDLAECLVQRDHSLHEFGAFLLSEVEEYRKKEAERKKARSKESKDSALSKESKDSALSDLTQSFNHSIIQSNNKEKQTQSASPPSKKKSKKPVEDGLDPKVLKVYEFWRSLLKASTRKADCLKWISRRAEEHGFETLVMCIKTYSKDCIDNEREAQFIKEPANFFGEDATYEGFLPTPEVYEAWVGKAREVLNAEKA